MFEETIASRIRPLAAAFGESDLVRLSVRDGEFELDLERSAPPAPIGATAGTNGSAATAAAPPKPDIVTSDLVGVVRMLRPQVGEGQQLESDRDLAFVEALGIRNPVRSHGPGRVAAVFVTDGQPVEYGQPLFAIERT
jgi:acetyl-CoA carboxylase biotin carboxyl carrier protein